MAVTVMPKTKSRQFVLNAQTGWEPILRYAERALTEAQNAKERRRIGEAIEICRRNIAAGVRIPMPYLPPTKQALEKKQ